jgi:hypothetical protein
MPGPNGNEPLHFLGGFVKLQKLGGYAAIAAMCVGTAGTLALFPVLQRRFGELSDPTKIMMAVSAAPALFYVLNLSTIVAYFLMLVMVFALHELMQAKAPHLTRMMLIAGSAGTVMVMTEGLVYLKGMEIVAPTQDVSAYRAYTATAAGIGAMGSIAYGCACLLMGCAILKTHALSRILGWLVLLMGILAIIGFMGMIPHLGDIFHLIAVPTTVWIGIALLRPKLPQPAGKEMVESR